MSSYTQTLIDKVKDRQREIQQHLVTEEDSVKVKAYQAQYRAYEDCVDILVETYEEWQTDEEQTLFGD